MPKFENFLVTENGENLFAKAEKVNNVLISVPSCVKIGLLSALQW